MALYNPKEFLSQYRKPLKEIDNEDGDDGNVSAHVSIFHEMAIGKIERENICCLRYYSHFP